MKNEKGITLVELIAVLAIAGIIVALIASVLSSGTNASQRTSLNQKLQQEGNVIVEKIRAHYLLNQNENNAINEKFEVVSKNGKLLIIDENGVSMVISEGYHYDLDPEETNESAPSKKKVQLDRTKKSDFNLIIRGKTTGNSAEQEYNINTSFSKLN